ncbi:unnamed protein product, partial [Candidula unifasciata]
KNAKDEKKLLGVRETTIVLNEREMMNIEKVNNHSNLKVSSSVKLCENDNFQSCKTDLVQLSDPIKKFATWKFIVSKNVLLRIYQKGPKVYKQTVLPQKFRPKALSLAHDSIFSGHMGITKTKKRILSTFYWPGFSKDVKNYVQSCDTCAKTTKKGENPKAPVQIGLIASRPFEQVAIDIVGPLPVTSAKGNRFILTFIDVATKWPECVPLKFITSNDIQE